MADSQVQLDFPADVMHVVPWVDPVVDALGFDPRSDYVELFWLGVIGPSTTWFMRRLAAGFDRSPEGFTLDLVDTARRSASAATAARSAGATRRSLAPWSAPASSASRSRTGRGSRCAGGLPP